MKFAITLVAVIFAVQVMSSPLLGADNGATNLLTAKVNVALNSANTAAAPITKEVAEEVPTGQTGNVDCDDSTPVEQPYSKPDTTANPDEPCEDNNAYEENKPDDEVVPEDKPGLIGGLLENVGNIVDGAVDKVRGIVHTVKGKEDAVDGVKTTVDEDINTVKDKVAVLPVKKPTRLLPKINLGVHLL